MTNGREPDSVHPLERVSVRVITVLGWIAAMISLTTWLGWWSLSDRVTILERGTTTPMGETTRIRFEQIEAARARIDRDFDRMEQRLERYETRIRELETHAP